MKTKRKNIIFSAEPKLAEDFERCCAGKTQIDVFREMVRDRLGKAEMADRLSELLRISRDIDKKITRIYNAIPKKENAQREPEKPRPPEQKPVK
jgi:hypothetical protein